MALGDLMASRLSGSPASVANHLEECSGVEERNASVEGGESGDVGMSSSSSPLVAGAAVNSSAGRAPSASGAATTVMAYLPQNAVLCEFRHEGFEDCISTGPSDNGVVSKWRPKDRAGCVEKLDSFLLQNTEQETEKFGSLLSFLQKSGQQVTA